MFRSRRPVVPSLANPTIPMSQTKKGQNNFFPFLPQQQQQQPTSQNQSSIRPGTSVIGGNFLSSQNGELGQNFPSINVKTNANLFFF